MKVHIWFAQSSLKKQTKNTYTIFSSLSTQSTPDASRKSTLQYYIDYRKYYIENRICPLNFSPSTCLWCISQRWFQLSLIKKFQLHLAEKSENKDFMSRFFVFVFVFLIKPPAKLRQPPAKNLTNYYLKSTVSSSLLWAVCCIIRANSTQPAATYQKSKSKCMSSKKKINGL